MPQFIVAAASGTVEIPELDITLTTTPVDLAVDFLLSDLWDSATLLSAIEAGTVIVSSANGIGWALAGSEVDLSALRAEVDGIQNTQNLTTWFNNQIL